MRCIVKLGFYYHMGKKILLIFIIGLLSILNIESYCVEAYSSENTKIYPSEDISAPFVNLSEFDFVLQNLPPEIRDTLYKRKDVCALVPKIKTKHQDSEWDGNEEPELKKYFGLLAIILSISSVIVFLIALAEILDCLRERNFKDLLIGIGFLLIPCIVFISFFIIIPSPTSCVIYFDNASSDAYDVLVRNVQSFKIQPNSHIRKVINLGWLKDIKKIDLSINLQKTTSEKKKIILVVDDDGKYLFNIDNLNSYYIETADYIAK